MTVQTTIALAATKVRSLDTGVFNISNKWLLPATTNGDSHVLMTMPHAGRMSSMHLKVPATLGAAAICKLQKRDAVTTTAIDITAATTAATAGVVTGAAVGPFDYNAGDTIELIVSGGNLTAQATANVETDLLAQHA